MNVEDRRMSAIERDASPERFPGREQVEAPRNEHFSRTSVSSSDSSVRMEEIQQGGVIRRDTGGMSRVPTLHETDYDLERHPTALSRIHTHRSQHSATVGAGSSAGIGVFRTRSSKASKPLPAFGGGKSYPPPLPDREEYVVEYTGADDPLHPQNWPMRKKIPIAAALGYVTLCAAFGSSVFSAATSTVAEHFHVSTEVGILGVSLYVRESVGSITGYTYSHALGTGFCIRTDPVGTVL